MASYLSPGVYVEEVASGSAPIAGVSTSTAGFIGKVTGPSGTGTGTGGENGSNLGRTGERTVKIDPPIAIKFADKAGVTFAELIKSAADNGKITSAEQANATIVSGSAELKFFVDGNTRPRAFTLDPATASTTVKWGTLLKDGMALTGTFSVKVAAPANSQSAEPGPITAAASEVKLCTNFSEFKGFFGDFSATDTDHSYLAHAVNGFFRNGGSRCFVVKTSSVKDALNQFEAIDEIAIVAIPGNSTQSDQQLVVDHCAIAMQDRVAILDTPAEAKLSSATLVSDLKKFDSNYAALYFPWIQVFDPAVKADKPKGDGLVYMPPSGHMAGVYARVDSQRGVHKAPANEVVAGAIGLKYPVSKRVQDGLNPKGINCIRALNGNIRVWGARTMGGDDNGEFKYINVRRLFNFLRESIDEGTQWTVFEPNSPALWAGIRRSLTDFLTVVWRSGALFGSTPEEAFFVKCDAETNPEAERDLGRVTTLVGVAVVKPAEFVIFKISQKREEG